MTVGVLQTCRLRCKMSFTAVRALCIITGASKGFGQAVARQMSAVLKPGSGLVLVARSAEDLRALREELMAPASGSGDLQVETVAADLTLNYSPEEVMKAATNIYTHDMDHVLLVNNAASMGDMSRFFKGHTNMADVNAYMSLNVSSALCLTAKILETFPRHAGLRRTVVNVSSQYALKPFSSWTLYCTGKAARDMMFRVLAEEEPDVRVLNYAPGAMYTDMLSYNESMSANPNLRKWIRTMMDEGEVLTCDESCTKLMKLLLEDSYESGAHIDVNDV